MAGGLHLCQPLGGHRAGRDIGLKNGEFSLPAALEKVGTVEEVDLDFDREMPRLIPLFWTPLRKACAISFMGV